MVLIRIPLIGESSSGTHLSVNLDSDLHPGLFPVPVLQHPKVMDFAQFLESYLINTIERVILSTVYNQLGLYFRVQLTLR